MIREPVPGNPAEQQAGFVFHAGHPCGYVACLWRLVPGNDTLQRVTRCLYMPHTSATDILHTPTAALISWSPALFLFRTRSPASTSMQQQARHMRHACLHVLLQIRPPPPSCSPPRPPPPGPNALTRCSSNLELTHPSTSAHLCCSSSRGATSLPSSESASSQLCAFSSCCTWPSGSPWYLHHVAWKGGVGKQAFLHGLCLCFL